MLQLVAVYSGSVLSSRAWRSFRQCSLVSGVHFDQRYGSQVSLSCPRLAQFSKSQPSSPLGPVLLYSTSLIPSREDDTGIRTRESGLETYGCRFGDLLLFGTVPYFRSRFSPRLPTVVLSCWRLSVREFLWPWYGGDSVGEIYRIELISAL